MFLQVKKFSTNYLFKIAAIIFIALSFALGFMLENSFALEPDNSSLQLNIQTQQNLNREKQDLIRQKEAEEIENVKELKAISEIENKSKDAPEICEITNACRLIENFTLSGNSKFSTKFLFKKFLRNHQNQCLTKYNLNKIRQNIENFYIAEGYFLARVYLDLKYLEQKKNIIGIVIEEGKIFEIEVTDNSKVNAFFPWRRRLQRFFALPFFGKNDVVNLRDIEQGLDQINRLASQQATNKFDAAEQAGYSKLLITNNVSDQLRLNFTADNSGNERTGKQKRKVGFNQDNLLGIGDNFYLNYSQSNNFDSNVRYSKAFYGAVSLPFGYYTLGASYSHSQYLISLAQKFATIKSSGSSEIRSFYIERVLWREKTFKTSLKNELEITDNNSYSNDTYLSNQSNNFTNANFYLNNRFFTKSFSLYLQPSYSKGLTAFGAKKDERNLGKSAFHAQYESFGFYAQLSKDFNLPKLNFPLNYKLTFDSNYSKDKLYGVKQFSIGGRYTVRGFQETVISGDNGYYVRNDLKTSLNNLVPQGLAAFSLGQDLSLNSILQKTSLGLFYDFGYVRDKIVARRSDEGHMSGAGFGLNYLGKNFNWDLTYSKALHTPAFLDTADNISAENETIYFSATFNLGLL